MNQSKRSPQHHVITDFATMLEAVLANLATLEQRVAALEQRVAAHERGNAPRERQKAPPRPKRPRLTPERVQVMQWLFEQPGSPSRAIAEGLGRNLTGTRRLLSDMLNAGLVRSVQGVYSLSVLGVDRLSEHESVAAES